MAYLLCENSHYLSLYRLRVHLARISSRKRTIESRISSAGRKVALKAIWSSRITRQCSFDPLLYHVYRRGSSTGRSRDSDVALKGIMRAPLDTRFTPRSVTTISVEIWSASYFTLVWKVNLENCFYEKQRNVDRKISISCIADT